MSKNLKILINFTLYILCFLVVCLVGSSGVFALSYTNVSELRDITQQLVSTNYGSGPFTNPINSGYAFSDVLQVDYIISNYNFVANTNYQLESHLTNQQLDNANYYSVQGLNGESCLISYQNSIFQDAYPRWAFQCPHNTNTITITIKNSSNQYLWSGTGIFNWTTALLKMSDTSLSGGDDSTDAIINNQNQNTQDIINNNNQNSQNIIDNQNELLGTKCDNLFDYNLSPNDINLGNFTYTLSNGIFTFNGSDSNYKYIGYNIRLNKGTYYWGAVQNGSGFNGISSMITYNNNNIKLFCDNSNCSFKLDEDTNIIFYPFRLGGSSFTANNFVVKPFISKTNNSFCEYGSYSSKLDDTNNSINNVDNTLKDDSVDENGVADAFNSFNDFLDDNSTITQLLTLPITLYTAILNNLNGTCQPFNLGKLYGEDLILPCINISQYLGNSLWTMIDIIISGFAVYAISKKMIKVFNNFSSLREGDVIDD